LEPQEFGNNEHSPYLNCGTAGSEFVGNFFPITQFMRRCDSKQLFVFLTRPFLTKSINLQPHESDKDLATLDDAIGFADIAQNRTKKKK
jgi:hypothetical protein